MMPPPAASTAVLNLKPLAIDKLNKFTLGVENLSVAFGVALR
jgi:hypothetical protein